MKVKIKSLLDIASVAAYLARIEAEPRSIRTAVVREQWGRYWKDIAIIRFSRNGDVECRRMDYAPTKDEAKAIKTEIEDRIEFPRLVRLTSLLGPDIPSMIRSADPSRLFEFRDHENKIIMVQVRRERENGEKTYVPWTFWDDNEWRALEPEGKLPLYGTDALKDNTVVFIHEGAKAAKIMREMIEAKTMEQKTKLANHPWGAELSNAAHIGWIGGALSPARTDWSVLQRHGTKRAYIVADNDIPGRSAVAQISEQLDIVTYAVNFHAGFPASFDLGDDFPENMFEEINGKVYYNGSRFQDCLRPATWATNQIPQPVGKPKTVLRRSFLDQWVYVPGADQFVCKDLTQFRYSEHIFNKVFAPFSHVPNLSNIVARTDTGPHIQLCYRPDWSGLRVVIDKGVHSINLFNGTSYRPIPGSVQPFLDYLAYMFPNAIELKTITRWLATLIGKPDQRMHYGLLLVSETQGIGKTTLGEAILLPLVGPENISFPSDTDITGDYTDWLAFKRLVFINEIYQGASWSTYHKLKSKITDSQVHVNRKYEKQFAIDNWAHVIACSNSIKALKMDHGDRRWFYPKMADKYWSRQQFGAFRAWLVAGGLHHILYWAQNYGDYVLPGERAPATQSKNELVILSRSEAQNEAVHIAEALVAREVPTVLLGRHVMDRIRSGIHGHIREGEHEIRKTMVEAGCRVWKERIKIGPMKHYIIMNEPAYEKAVSLPDDEQNAYIRSKEVMLTVAALCEEPM